MSFELNIDKINESIKEFKTAFHKWDIMRDLFETVKYSNYLISLFEEDFVTIGHSSLIPRNFFSNFEGTTYYDYAGIGSNYGKSIAFGETKYILNIIENKIDEDDKKQCEKTRITSLIAVLFNTYPDVRFGILANPTIISEFMTEKEFELRYSDTIWGLFNERPLYWNPEISKNIVYLVDRDLGKLYVKEDISMEVQEIKPSEYEKVLKDVPSFTISDLEKVIRIKTSEQIYFMERDELRNGVIKITFPEP